MKAAQAVKYGGQEAVKTDPNAPRPTITADQVLVEVYAAGVNPFDFKVREGQVRQMAELTFPATLGGDLAGVVAEVGENVQGLTPGTAVYGQAGALSGHGSFAEYAPVASGSLAPKPANLDFIQAAALPLAAVSAYQALVEVAGLAGGQTVLIHGGAGGIGSLAIQIAAHLGARVTATAAGAHKDYVLSLGANTALDYQAEPLTAQSGRYDVVFDTVGDDVYEQSFAVIKPGGIVVTMSARPNEALAAEHHARTAGMHTQVTAERLAAVTKLVEAGVLAPHVDKVFPLDEAAAALDYLQHGRPKGKVVIAVKPS
ncbi:MAG TPA: NADP-dependent oxidoreductase [Candidatus Saccharimonadia bacterium]|nr:NADP-dependent oxidoreductase [Candidatus Saccharimonadia bacterium]